MEPGESSEWKADGHRTSYLALGKLGMLKGQLVE